MEAAVQREVACHCGAPMQLRQSTYGPFYRCADWPTCDGVHGAHPDGRPMGKPADRETRRARVEAHAVFDAWWQARGMTRDRAYRWLKRIIRPGHIASFDAAQCQRLIEVCEFLGTEVPIGRVQPMRKG